MLLCTSTTDKLQLITGQAVNIDVHVSGMDVDNTGAVTSYRKNTAVATATTADINAVPGANVTRNIKTVNIRNKSTSASCDCTVQHTDGTTIIELIKTTLQPGQTLQYVEGVGWNVVSTQSAWLINESTAQQGAGFSADTYLVGSSIIIPVVPQIGTAYKLIFDVAKTAAGTATPIINVRIGAAGSTADTSHLTFAFAAGTAAIDTAVVECLCVFRSVGGGTSAVLQGQARATTNLTTTGWSASVKALQLTAGAGFDSSAINGQIIGASYNGGTSAVHTIQLVRAELIP